ncbi:MAG: hypothetical protein AAGB19_12545 [Cyanobacteria bacterium P01_F01_bin.3]
MTYKKLAKDTSIHIEQMHLAALKKAGLAKRVAIASTHTKRMQQLSLNGFKRRNRSSSTIRQKFATALLGAEPTFKLGSEPNVWADSDPFDLACELHSILNRIGVDYFVTGGVAACCHGEPRATVDLDLVIQIESKDVDILGKTLEESGFYVPQINLENIATGVEKSLNIIHQEKCTKADLIVASMEPFDISRMSRREFVEPGFYICSAEDTILKKLNWSRRSQSEKQWRDVQTILRIQSDSLDFEYMNHWAIALAVEEALQDALSDAGLR